MDPKVFRKFAELVGNKADLIPVANEYDEDKPDNWEEMTEEEQAAWMEKHTVKPNASIPAATVPQKQTVIKAEVPAEVIQFKNMVDEMGGMEVFKSLLLNTAIVLAKEKTQEESERENLSEVIIANSQFAQEDLQDIPLPALRKLAANMTSQSVNYAPLSPAHNKTNKDAVAPRPAFLLANRQAN